MILAIDGPAASGKSTVAKAVAARLGFRYLDTGAMYRALAFKALEQGVSLDDEEGLARMAEHSDIEFERREGEALPSKVLLDGRDVSRQIRTPHVDAAVSLVARVPKVRQAMVVQQRRLVAAGDWVVEGRDIGTVVFPDADLKVYVIASPEERARRRQADLARSGHDAERDEVMRDLMERDTKDSKRPVSPLRPAEDAALVDTTGRTVDEVVAEILGKMAR